MQLSENLQGSTQRRTHNSHPHPNEQIATSPFGASLRGARINF